MLFTSMSPLSFKYYQNNMQQIIEALFTHSLSHDTIPTLYELAHLTGISEEEILESMEFANQPLK